VSLPDDDRRRCFRREEVASMNPGVWVGITGAALGVLGGAAGTYASLRAARSPRERRFIIKAAVVTWAGVTVFVALIVTLSSPYKWLLWIPYTILLSLGIVWMNRRLAALRYGGGRL
jgi:hypothetical protein